MIAAGIEDGRLLRSVSKSGKVNRDTLSDWAVWSVVEQSSKQIGIEHFGAHDLFGGSYEPVRVVTMVSNPLGYVDVIHFLLRNPPCLTKISTGK